jgi:hypothetical protein
MAVVLPHALPPKRPRRWRWLAIGLGLVAMLLAVFWTQVNGYAQVGTAYGARVACSCRFLGGRSLSDCRKDFEPGMELVMLSEDTKAKSVTASLPLLASETARLHNGEGCRLDPWQE